MKNKILVPFLIYLIIILNIQTSLAATQYPNIHTNSIIVDSHNDTMDKVIDEETWLPKVDIGKSTSFHIDISKLKHGGLNVPFFGAFTEGYYGNTGKSISRTLALINALYWTETKNFKEFTIVRSEREIEEATRLNKIAAISSIEGAYSLDKHNAINIINQYYDLKVSAIGLTWNYSNELGEGAKGVFGDKAMTKSPKGLTKLGEEVVKEMNRLGIIIDVSHMSQATFFDVIKHSKAPIMATHSGVYNLKNHNRNLTDRQLKALAKNRGVINIVLYPAFLTNRNSTYIKDFVDHIDYVVNLIGIDYVGIGSDFDGATIPLDIKDSSEFYKITNELLSREYSSEDIGKILGKNSLRVLNEVQEIGQENVNNSDLGIYMGPNFRMGEIIKDKIPLLSARIESENGFEAENLELKVIINGISHTPVYDADKSLLYYQILKPLEEKFYVVSFEASNDNGEVYRKTRIFYVE